MGEWILVLVFSAPIGGGQFMTHIGGFTTLEACEATLTNAVTKAETRFKVSAISARLMFGNSFCFERAK